jgi:two-component system, oxyanion-binding sensor
MSQPPTRRLTIGLLRLTDAAPVVAAKELGFFDQLNLDVALSVEPSWANIADKLSYGQLDAAVMLPPLAFAIALGVRGVARRLIVPMSLSLNGNSITLAHPIADAVAPDAVDAAAAGRSLRGHMAAMQGRLRLAVVHAFSTHNLLLRYWLASGGIDPERDVAFTVVPPAETVDALAAGCIDGFCAGAPWGEVAARAGLGRTVATSHAIWNHGTEKIFAVRRRVAEEHPAQLQAILRAVLRAAAYCDDPANARDVALILAQDCYLGLPPEIILTSLPGAPARSEADVSVFFANAANFPWRSHARWFLGQMRRWDYLDTDAEVAAAIFRPDLFIEAASSLGLPVPTVTSKTEGTHTAPWQLPASPTSIAMGPDQFIDGAVFDAE